MLSVPDALAGSRLDRVLALLLPALSRSRLKGLIEAGHLRDASGATIVEASLKVKSGACYEIDIPPTTPAVPEPQAMPLTVLYEDDDLIVIDKPAGLVVHPAPGNPDRTLVNALLAHCGDSLSGVGGVRRPGIVHRLDKDTSGVMMAAKNDLAHAGLARQFAEHSVERAYLALTFGCPLPAQGTIEGNIGRHPRDRKRMAVVAASGRAARTHYRVLQRFGPPLQPAAALVRCELETGRTHQVRVHLASRGHPLLGDPVYGRGRGSRGSKGLMAAVGDFQRQALHAAVLGFCHPRTAKMLRFESSLPNDINALIKSLQALSEPLNNPG